MRLLSFAACEERRRGWRYEAIGAQRGLLGAGVFDICKRYGREGAQGQGGWAQGGREAGAVGGAGRPDTQAHRTPSPG
ncbi:hypothetical protein GWK36_07300 [Caldichromatium japonicum]|uniref:Uncharacterized protein n=1 Tax=Caldichromatium japonicum TaxID=2699430 RepID=A0A6G7VD40_9GAMM|nr:hypothetical protein [Caldichromatium japonicum]QIK37820.1 hypothetical protein GWK36_07300 [Caldichromatium japonicum]